MKFDMFDALNILAAEFGSGRSIIEVEDRISSYTSTWVGLPDLDATKP